MDTQVEEIEVDISTANAAIKLMDSLKSLTKNKDFQDIVDTGYFVTEASRVVLLKADPAMQTPEFQESLDKQLVAIAYLRQYFVVIMQTGRMAERAKEDAENAREEILAEENQSHA